MLRLAITDRRLPLSSSERSETELTSRLVARCARLTADEVDYLLLREKDLPARDLTNLSRAVVQAVRDINSQTKILIARRPDIALATAADGVHLTTAPGELTPAQVRRIMPEAFVTVSCHTLAEVARARSLDASAILFGPVFGKTIDGKEVTAALGLDLLAQACVLASPTPVFALGGITPARVPACQSAGAQGIAAIRMFFS